MIWLIDDIWWWGSRFQVDGHPHKHTLIARFMRSTWGPPGDDRTQMGPILAPFTLLSGHLFSSSQAASYLQGSIMIRFLPRPTCTVTSFYWIHPWHMHSSYLSNGMLKRWLKCKMPNSSWYGLEHAYKIFIGTESPSALAVGFCNAHKPGI